MTRKEVKILTLKRSLKNRLKPFNINSLRRILNWAKGLLSTRSRSSILSQIRKPKTVLLMLEITGISNLDKKDIEISFEPLNINAVFHVGKWNSYYIDDTGKYFTYVDILEKGENAAIKVTIIYQNHIQTRLIYF